MKYFDIYAIALPITLKKATAKTPAIVDPGEDCSTCCMKKSRKSGRIPLNRCRW